MSRVSNRLAFIAALTVFFATSAFAFDVSVKANVDNAQVFVGDMFNYEIQVVAPESATVDLPSFVGNLGSFEVKEMKNEKLTDGMPKGTAKFVWLATLNTFVSGDFIRPAPAAVALYRADGRGCSIARVPRLVLAQEICEEGRCSQAPALRRGCARAQGTARQELLGRR